MIRITIETIQFNFNKWVNILDFTAFVQPFEMSIVIFSTDREANEVFYEVDDFLVTSKVVFYWKKSSITSRNLKTIE
ncbi:hypothetical protein [Bacillus toyonensis]|uniref:hypothetical protein n=1 Tax=Bacillus toyonensis TaxID=155322 RepID=UPI0035C73CE4